MGLPVPGNRKVGASLCVVTNVEMAFIFKTGRQLLLSSESVVFPSVACKYMLGAMNQVHAGDRGCCKLKMIFHIN